MPPTVKVGLSASLTGQFATQGRQALAGLRAWIADLNRSGGLPVADRRRTLPVALRHYDDGSRAEGTIQATRRLLEQDRVDLLFGPYSAGLTQTAAAVAAERGRLLWNQGGASDSVYRPGRRVVGILAPAGQYLAALPALVRRADPAARTFAILRCSTGAFSRQVSGGLEGQALALGFEKTRHCEFPPEAADFSDLIDRVAQQPPDLLLAVGRIRHDLALAALLAQRRRSGVFREGRPGAVAVVAAPIAQFRAALGADAAGFIGPSQWEPPEESADSPAFIPDYGPTGAEVMASLRREGHAAGNLPVDYPMAQAYAAGLVAQRCVAAAGTLEEPALWQAALKLDFTTFYGRFRLEPESGRPVGRSPLIVQWQRGRKAVLNSPELPPPPLAYPWAALPVR